MATSIHERGDGVPATLLRKKADPAQEWADGLPEVAEGETVTVLRVEGAFTDTACEDYQTGVFIPCDDAGIPGLGGSNSPCGTYFQLSHGIPTRAPQLRRSGERPRRNSDCTLPS